MGIVYVLVFCGIGYFILLCVSKAERKAKAAKRYNQMRSEFKPSEFPDSSWFHEYRENVGKEVRPLPKYTPRRLPKLKDFPDGLPKRGSGR